MSLLTNAWTSFSCGPAVFVREELIRNIEELIDKYSLSIEEPSGYISCTYSVYFLAAVAAYNGLIKSHSAKLAFATAATVWTSLVALRTLVTMNCARADDDDEIDESNLRQLP